MDKKLFVHAGFNRSSPINDQPDKSIFWFDRQLITDAKKLHSNQSPTKLNTFDNFDTIYIGHTPVQNWGLLNTLQMDKCLESRHWFRKIPIRKVVLSWSWFRNNISKWFLVNINIIPFLRHTFFTLSFSHYHFTSLPSSATFHYRSFHSFVHQESLRIPAALVSPSLHFTQAIQFSFRRQH